MAKGLERGRGPVLILPWGNEIEDYLDPIGIDLRAFAERMEGGWLFGYADALRMEGWRVVILVLSRSVEARTAYSHAQTGASIVALPSPAPYRAIRRALGDPYAFTPPGNAGRIRRLGWRALRTASPFLANLGASLLMELRRQSPSAVICQEYEDARFDVLSRLCKRLGIRCLATFQGGQIAFPGLEAKLRPGSLARADLLIVPSASEVERLARTYTNLAPKIVKISNPVDLSAWPTFSRGDARTQLGWGDEPTAIWHGRIDIRNKGLDILLASWSRVVELVGPASVRLVLVGDGADADEFGRMLAARRFDAVEWRRGFLVDRSAMSRLLHAADVFLMTSRNEGFPVAPLEAMASSLPVVLSDAQGCADILVGTARPCGSLVPRDNPEATAQALAFLLKNKGTASEWGRNAREHVASRFSPVGIGRALTAAIEGPP